MIKCSWCGKEIEDLIIKTILSIKIYRKTYEDVVETIENGESSFYENLCPACFEKFSKVIQENMNNV